MPIGWWIAIAIQAAVFIAMLLVPPYLNRPAVYDGKEPAL